MSACDITTLMKNTLCSDNKNKIFYMRDGVKHVRTYKRTLKVPYAFSTLDLVKENISRNNILLAKLRRISCQLET